jgi:hypothetical protein
VHLRESPALLFLPTYVDTAKDVDVALNAQTAIHTDQNHLSRGADTAGVGYLMGYGRDA